MMTTSSNTQVRPLAFRSRESIILEQTRSHRVISILIPGLIREFQELDVPVVTRRTQTVVEA